MRRDWELEDLIECWTLDEDEFALVGNKTGATRLGFSLLLKFFEQEGRFPRREDVPRPAMEFMADQVKVDATLLADYAWSGSTIDYHRKQVREFYGFRTITVGDVDKLIIWMAEEICPVETSRDRLRAAFLTQCRNDKIEPPKPGQVERLLGAAEAMFERQFTTGTVARIPAAAAGKLKELLTAPAPDVAAAGSTSAGSPGAAAGGGRGFLQELEDPGPLTLDTLLAEIVKLELLIQLVHKISVRAERKVEKEIGAEFRRVYGKNGILVRLAQAALDLPEELVREAIYPVVGTRTLQGIIAEAKANEKVFNTRVWTKLRGSYSHHYRRGLPKLLRAVEFGSGNESFQPVMDALALLDRYADSDAEHYDQAETVPLEHVEPDDWRDAVVDAETGLVERIPYELCVLVALRKAIRRREVWVVGGNRGRNPEDDLLGNFAENREVHYAALKNLAIRPSSSPTCRNAT